MSSFQYNTSFGSVSLEVSTEEMDLAASEILTKINNVQSLFDNLFSTMSSTSSYWIGEVGDNERSKLSAKKDSVTGMINNLNNFVLELQQMGENYTQAEENSFETAQELPSGILQ